MVQRYARQSSTPSSSPSGRGSGHVRHIQRLLDRLRARGILEFTAHDVKSEQDALLAQRHREDSVHYYTGRYDLNVREIGTTLQHHQQAFGIEPAGYREVYYSSYSGSHPIRVWRFKD